MQKVKIFDEYLYELYNKKFKEAKLYRKEYNLEEARESLAQAKIISDIRECFIKLFNTERW